MYRVTRDDLETMLSVALRVAPEHLKAKLKSKLPIERDAASDALAKLLVERIDNGGSMVIRAEPVPNGVHGQRPGVFGVDEPDPIAHRLVVIPALNEAQG